MFMEKLQTTHIFYVFGTSDLTQIEFVWPRGPQRSREGPQGSREGPQGGRGVPRAPFRHPYGRLAHPIGHRGAMSHDTVGTRAVHHGVSQVTL